MYSAIRSSRDMENSVKCSVSPHLIVDSTPSLRRPAVPRSSKRRLRIETLETRATPAIVTWAPGGIISVFGGPGIDKITVQEQPGVIKVLQSNVVTNSFLPSAVTRVFIDGGAGDDILDVSTLTRKAILIGGANDDSMTGGLGADEIYGRDGDDSILGGGGNDKLFGENGNDSVGGEIGNDSLFGGIGDDVLAGNAGDDTIFCEAGNDVGSGGDGKDKVLGNVGDDSLFGGAGNDDLKGEDGSDQITGDDGNDSLDGGSGNDTVTGLLGDDEMYGQAGNDSLEGGDGNDTIFAGAGNDRANGGAGDDQIKGEDGDDTLHGDAGNDIIAGGAGSDFVFGDDGNDIVAANVVGDVVNGGPGNDTISAGSGDVVDGGGGTDTVISGGDDDNNNGGGGNTNQDPPASAYNNTVHVFQTVRNQWNNGATIDITIRNRTANTINAWKVEFDADFDIYEQWSAQYLGESSDHFTFQNNPGTTIGPNQSFTFGFNVNLASGISRAIRNLEFNDAALTAGTPPGNPNPNPNPNTQGTVSQTVISQWDNGAIVNLIVQNTGNTQINGWTVEFDANFDISNIWDAQIVSRNGNHYTIRNQSWNAAIPANNQKTLGFQVFLSAGDTTAVSNVKLNGVSI